jgi:hypothetical protein
MVIARIVEGKLAVLVDGKPLKNLGATMAQSFRRGEKIIRIRLEDENGNSKYVSLKKASQLYQDKYHPGKKVKLIPHSYSTKR